ncbi:DUF4173 domain-containing protein [Nocardioides sp. B-3]|nr:DUF4173 domain-containing protein [Nocardioides sp. B-3]UUZ58987.1 DUF4173 domain-containing protein [Nocardioides sp. B-3]
MLLVDAVFLLFPGAQATAFFGGHDYVEETTSLTYADYVHRGFGQLTFATVLTLFVVWAAARKVKDEPLDRLWMRGSLGLLCALTPGGRRVGVAPDEPVPGRPTASPPCG